MAENSKIEWTDHTFNPWRGCTKVSEGCRHCYADTMSKRNPGTLGIWGPNGTRVVASESMWREPLKWDREAANAGVRRRVFSASLADVFEDWGGGVVNSSGQNLYDVGDGCFRPASEIDPREWPGFDPGNKVFAVTFNDMRARLFTLIDETRNLDWLLLTKRPENVDSVIGKATWQSSREWFDDCKHVWIGTSIENQETADKRIPHLLKTRASVRFLSIEPLLGPIDLGKWLCTNRANWQCQKCGGFLYRYDACNHCGGSKDYLTGSHVANKRDPGSFTGWTNRQPIDWVIVGGESGQHARPMHPEWARSLRDQCVSAGVPFFFKQWGEWIPYEHDAQPPFWQSQHVDIVDGHALPSTLTDRINETVNGWMLDDQHNLYRLVGKKAAGRLLDGLVWNEMPDRR